MLRKSGNLSICPTCVLNGELTEVSDITEKDNMFTFTCPTHGLLVMEGKAATIKLPNLYVAATISLGWNIRLLMKIVLKVFKTDILDSLPWKQKNS